jgi:hypothetical protein
VRSDVRRTLNSGKITELGSSLFVNDPTRLRVGVLAAKESLGLMRTGNARLLVPTLFDAILRLAQNWYVCSSVERNWSILPR